MKSLYPLLLPRASCLTKPTELLHHLFDIRPGDAKYRGYRLMAVHEFNPEMAVIDVFKLKNKDDHFGDYLYAEWGKSWDGVVIQTMYWIDKHIKNCVPMPSSV